jgi:hypothetical protein
MAALTNKDRSCEATIYPYSLDSLEVAMDPKDQRTLLQQVWNWIHNNRVAVVVLIFAAAVIGLAQLTDAVGKLRQFVGSSDPAAKAEYCELLAPLIVQLDRTRSTFARWTGKDLSLESETIREGNNEARRLLMTKAHLIPAQLENDSRRLIEHYDRWAEEYDRIRVRQKNSDEPFVFAGPAGFPFPKDAEERFRARTTELRASLGAEIPCK